MRKNFITIMTLMGLLLGSSCARHTVDFTPEVHLIPQPVSMEQGKGSFVVDGTTSMVTSREPGLAEQLLSFSDAMTAITGDSYKMQFKNYRVSNAISTRINPNYKGGVEGYLLTIDENGVLVEAADKAGLFYGIQTLKQLLPSEPQAKIYLPLMRIEDRPRFSWRGLMIDCSRHFWSVTELKKVMDRMARYKLNRLHLHLTDNQGWRLQVDAFPELVKKGTQNKLFPQRAGKYYSTGDIKNLLAYAAKKEIMVIPEIDLPGHSQSIMASYPELSCRGGAFEVYPPEQPRGEIKRGAENMLCLGNAQTFDFTKEVIKQTASMFSSPFIHMGGDEVGHGIWEKCTKCRALQKRENIASMGGLQDYYTKWVSSQVKEQGRRMIGWGEINDHGAAQPGDVVMIWRGHGFDKARKAIDQGLDIVLCPQHGCYFDWGYAGNATRKVYEWEPYSNGLSLADSTHILGAQACLWTERVATFQTLEERLFPRLIALAEVVWSPSETRDWDAFAQRLNREKVRMEKDGITYYKDENLEEDVFEPKEEKPALVRHAWIETNMGVAHPYHAEYAFDGRLSSFYWSNHSPSAGEYFKVTLGEPVALKKIRVITGDSKDYVTKADLEISTDQKSWKKVASFNEIGEAEASLEGETIKALRIKCTGDIPNWVVIREIILE